MSSLKDKVRRGEAIPAPIAAVLSAATVVQRVGMAIRHARKSVKVDAHVISIGNIAAGGTGKTPAVIERAQKEIDVGKKVAVLTRGYQGSLPPGVNVIPDDAHEWHRVAELFGDEPALIAKMVPGARVIKCVNRVAAARHAIEAFKCDTLILDDGFQYTPLARDEDIACIDAANPFGNGHILPRGILRESPSALARATSIVLTRCDQADDLDTVVHRIRQFAPNTPIRTTYHKPVSLWRVSDGEELPLSRVREATKAVCGVGNPDAFERTLRDLGASECRFTSVPNHAPIASELLRASGMTIVTEKDAIKIVDPPDNVYALAVRLCDYDPT